MAEPGSNPLARKKIPTWSQRAHLLDGEQHLIVEMIQPNICLITINRPEVKNAMSHRTRAQLFNQLQINDQDPDVRVTIIRGAEGNFSSGHDFDTNRDEILPFFEPEIDGQTSRHVLNGYFMMNDLAKPVVAMVEGEAIGGGLELAAACDVCICAEDAIIGYHPVRGQGLADYQVLPWLCGMRNAMELMLTNKPMTGIEAAAKGFATEVVPTAELEERTLNLAARIAKIPSDLLAFNKKSVHRAFEAQGMRTNLRNGVDLEALMFKAPGAKMLTVRRGPQKGTPAAERVPPPRPMPISAPIHAPAVAAQAVSAKSEEKPQKTKPQLMQAKLTQEPAQKRPAPPAKAPVTTPIRPTAPPAVATKQSSKPSTPAATGAATKPISVATATKPTTATPSAAPNPVSSKTPTAAAAPAKPVAAQGVKSASAPAATPIKKPTAQKPVVTSTSESSSSIAKPASPINKGRTEEVEEDEKAVHVHLHEAVHIHFGNHTPSKL
jgi:enoyl-CoA hydratase